MLATQNPIELEGTYELPEAQLDRFLMRLHIGYPDARSEMEIIDRHEKRWDRAELPAVVSPERFAKMTRVADNVHVGPLVKEYLIKLVAATRDRSDVRIGVSPRGSIALVSAARAWAAGHGRHFVTPDDVRLLAPHVLPHRIVVSPEAELRGSDGASIVGDILQRTPADETARS